MTLSVGDRVLVGSLPGIVRYYGTTSFATGDWVGIELIEAKGRTTDQFSHASTLSVNRGKESLFAQTLLNYLLSEVQVVRALKTGRVHDPLLL